MFLQQLTALRHLWTRRATRPALLEVEVGMWEPPVVAQSKPYMFDTRFLSECGSKHCKKIMEKPKFQNKP